MIGGTILFGMGVVAPVQYYKHVILIIIYITRRVFKTKKEEKQELLSSYTSIEFI